MMKKKNYLFLFLFFIFISFAFSQCSSNNKVLDYISKANKVKKNEIKKKSAYLQFAKYYEFVCECQNGVSKNREKVLVKLINRIVDVNKNYYSEKYGRVEKVYKCKHTKL